MVRRTGAGAGLTGVFFGELAPTTNAAQIAEYPQPTYR